MSDDDSNLTKVHVDLPNNPHTGGEAIWAAPLGGDSYELRNVPFYAYGLNFLDVVHAVAASENLKPTVLDVIRRSGHRTLWVTFPDDSDPEENEARLLELNKWKAYYEGATQFYFAIDVEPDGDYASVLRQLRAWQDADVLRYHAGEHGGFRSGATESPDDTTAA